MSLGLGRRHGQNDAHVRTPGTDKLARQRHPPTGSRRLAVPGVGGLVRPRLLTQLDGLLAGRLGVVVAGPGHGKTTLMGHWAQRTPIDVVWTRAQAGARDGLMGQLGAAVQELVPGGPPVAELEALLRVVEKHDSPLVLVVDDVHLLSPTDMAGLEQLALRGPRRLRLLLGSRTAPAFNSARTEVPTTTLTEPVLAFRGAEVAELFADAYGMRLTRDEVRRVLQETDGWAAALHLLHEGIVGTSAVDRARMLRRFDGRVRYARMYLREVLLAGVPQATIDFLRRTSALERLTTERCDALLATHDSQRHLQVLEDHPGLVTRSEDGFALVVQPVLRRHLFAELSVQLSDVEREDLQTEVGILLTAERSFGEAARAFTAARNWSALGRLLARHGDRVLGDHHDEWVARVPAAVAADDGWLQLCAAVRATRDGALEEAREHLDRTAVLATDGKARASWEVLDRQVRTWSEGDQQPGREWTELLRAALRNPDVVTRDRRQGPHGLLLRALGSALTGDFATAASQLDRGVARLDEHSLAALAGTLVATVLAPSPETAADVAAQAERNGMPWLARIAEVLAEAQYAVAGHDEADDSLLLDELAEAEARGDQWAVLLVRGARSTALLRQGVPDPQGLEEVVRQARLLDAPVLESWARAVLALVSAAQELPEAATEADAAVSFAAACGVPGAAAIGYGALAASRPHNRAEYLAMAEAEAARAGLTVRPWTWVGTPEQQDALATFAEPVDAPVWITCFGDFTLAVEGREPDLTRLRPRARTVLRMLAVHAGEPVHREVLADALWPDLDADAGRHNLHVAISSLRSCLEPDSPRGQSRLVQRDGERYRLHLPPGSWCDLDAFDRDLERARRARSAGDQEAALEALASAVETYRDDVLPADGPAEWVLPVRERYRQAVAEAATELAELHLARNVPDAAVAAALRSIAVDACRDSSWRLLIAAHEAAGDIAAAERARRAYVDVLDSLGVVSDSASSLLRPRRADD